MIPVDAHIRLAAPSVNDGARLLRRGYSFTDGINPVTNQLDAGLFFIAFQRDPRTAFIAVQQNLSTDALNEYIRHTEQRGVRGAARRGPGRLRGRDALRLTPRQLAAFSRMWMPQLEPRPMTWARPTVAPSIWRSPASPRNCVVIS